MEKEIERLLTHQEVCEILWISGSTFFRLARSGRLPAAKIGQQWRVRPSLLNRYIERQTVKPYRRKVGDEIEGKGESANGGT